MGKRPPAVSAGGEEGRGAAPLPTCRRQPRINFVRAPGRAALLPRPSSCALS